jgi:hypothetical protein
MVRIDLGVEPAHMPECFSIFMNDSMDTANMKGMLQVNASPPGHLPRGKPRAGWASRQIPWGSWSSETGRTSSRLRARCTYHVGCDGPGPQVSTVGEDVCNYREVNRNPVQHRNVHGMLRAIFGLFLPTDPESQDAVGGHIQAVDGRACWKC